MKKMIRLSVKWKKATPIAMAIAIMAGYTATAEVVEVSGKIVGIGAKYPDGQNLKLVGDTYFAFYKPGGFGGDIDLNGFKMAAGGSRCRFSGAITGDGEFRQKNIAGVTLSGNKPNTFKNTCVFVSGKLTLNKSAGVDAIPGDLLLGVQLGGTSLVLKNSDQINDSSHVTFEARGRPCSFYMGGNHEQIASLTVKDNLTIDMSGKPSALVVDKIAPDQLNLDKFILVRNFKPGKDKLLLNADGGGLTDEQLKIIGLINPTDQERGTYSVRLDADKTIALGPEVESVDPPFDLSPKARAARKEHYDVDGLEHLTGADTPLKDGMKIVFFGDSITMQGRYVRMFERALAAGAGTADLDIEVVRYGLNGGTAPDLLAGKSKKGNFKATMEELLRKEKPDIVSIWIGVNDVWFGEDGTTPEDFEAALEKMVELSRAVGAKVVLAPLAVLKEDAGNLNPKCDAFADITRKVAAEKGAQLADLRKASKAYMKNHGYTILPDGSMRFTGRLLAFDGVHFNDLGSEIVTELLAQAIYEKLEE